MLHRTDPEKGSARLAPPLPAHPQTANARGKVAENATLPLRQPAAAVRQAPFLPLLRHVTSHNNT
ncbi:MAG: hypothetical protein DYG98_08595 [Haliscomenobacteraceae bacterium CHB4]|nr:hypothetical protein [Haliscomenobacteraceae bacterium CHB4]